MQEIITIPGNFQRHQGFKTMLQRTVRYTLLLLNSTGRTGVLFYNSWAGPHTQRQKTCMAEDNSLEPGSVLTFDGIQESPRIHQPKPGLTHHNLTVSVHGAVSTRAPVFQGSLPYCSPQPKDSICILAWTSDSQSSNRCSHQSLLANVNKSAIYILRKPLLFVTSTGKVSSPFTRNEAVNQSCNTCYNVD